LPLGSEVLGSRKLSGILVRIESLIQLLIEVQRLFDAALVFVSLALKRSQSLAGIKSFGKFILYLRKCPDVQEFF